MHLIDCSRLSVNFVNLILSCKQIHICIECKDPQETCNTVSCLLLLTAYVCELFTVKTQVCSPRSHMREARSVTRSETYLTRKDYYRGKHQFIGYNALTQLRLKQTQARVATDNFNSDRALPDHFTPLFPFTHTNTHYLMKYVAQHCSSLFKLSTSILNTHLFILHALIQ